MPIVLSIKMLSVIMLNVIMLSVVAPPHKFTINFQFIFLANFHLGMFTSGKSG
jgi:hypothetical protein